jgi:hypothetical protein
MTATPLAGHNRSLLHFAGQLGAGFAGKDYPAPVVRSRQISRSFRTASLEANGAYD